MTKKQYGLQDRITFLEQEIRRHRDLYYNAEPEISDAKYDALEDELRELDPENSVFFEIGVDRSELFTKREHIIPMNSQDKVTTDKYFLKWAKKQNYKVFLVQFKLDGISLELQYEDGKFQYAVTRGDGQIGDDVSANVVKMRGFIPKVKEPITGAVRAEVMLFHDVFEQKYSDKQNCRNAAGGILRRKDGVGSENLNLISYDAISLDDSVTFSDEIKKLKWLKKQGFDVIKTKTVKSAQEVIDTRNRVIETVRDSLNYDIDGLVIKGREIDLEDMRRARPMKQIAFKFPAEEMETILKDVEWSISGQNYTPVAIVETVRLMGTNVSRASLANPNLIEELGAKIGSEVFVSKRGDIIPKIERVKTTPPGAKDIELPTICEVCSTPLVNEGTRLFCPNEQCPKRQYHRLVKWIRKLGVKHFSEKLMLRNLFDTGKVRKIADLYDLKVSDLTKFEGVKETSAKKALDNLYAIKEVPLARFVGAFDLENMGEKMIKRVVDAGFDTLEILKDISIAQLSRIEGFKDTNAGYLRNGIKVLYPEMLEVLNTNKIKIKEGKIMGGKLEGMTFCFTGKLDNMNRAEAEELVRENGGEPKGSVVKNLNYLVTNSTEETAKFKKAQAQGTKIISEAQFMEMINK